ncbi:hypothetical protein K1T71_005048 [Dendrolimus kikuchii]|uniref:Uncharacterized protein n=1 Tax=Dendrolimus kikuchii TaxID=765133 RepID=A0ACC1D641_9NEOP|nr:hypothetical protein K1T71_005048 [Dendrolimus kikuchii]
MKIFNKLPKMSVQKEYEKHTEIKPEDIENVQLWLEEQPHLPREHITDLDLILAYHSRDCNIEQAKQVIDLNYTLRGLLTFYSNREVDNCLERALQTWLVTPLSTNTKEGYRPIYCQLLDTNLNKFVYSDVVRAFVMIVDLWQYEEGTVPGVAIMLNMDKVSISHISRMELNVAQQFLYFLQEAMFIQLKEFHFVNAPHYINTLLDMIRPFLRKEMLDKIKVHYVGSNSLEEYLPLHALPKEAGGNYKDGLILRDEILSKLKANRKFFEEDYKKRVDESKRPGGPKSLSTFFTSVEETFKNLEID